MDRARSESREEDAEARRRRLAGLAALTAGDLPRAESELRAALAAQPRDEEAAAALADVLLTRAAQAGAPLDAAKAAVRALAPGAQRERLMERLELSRARRRETARARAARGRRRDARLESLRHAIRRLALSCSPGRRPARARALLARALALAPGDAPARAAAGIVLFGVGGPARRQGLALLAQALRLDAGGLSPAERFGALMKLGRAREAVAYAETLLEGAPDAAALRGFADPWDLEGRVADRARAIEGLRRSLPAGSPWLRYYLADLRGRAGAAHARALRRLGPRHSWMRAKSGLLSLVDGRAREAQACLRAALASPWRDWRTRALLGEALLCLGRPAEALAQLSRARAEAPAPERPQAQAWLGLLELWVGRYASARRRLERAARAGDPYAPAWAAAALLKLGRPSQALRGLDAALARFPGDLEAYVWRGEAKRLLGREREALADLSLARANPERLMVWAHVNRALAKEALGDRRGAAREYASIPSGIRARLGRACAERDPMRRLERALELARGYRRDEYDQRVWLS